MRKIFIGAVTGVFGIKGDIKVRPFVEDEEIFLNLETTELVSKDEKRSTVKVRKAKRHNDVWLISLEGVNTPEEAMTYKGYRLEIPEEALPAADTGEVYWIHIEGATVVDTEGKTVGKLVNYIETGAHDVFEIEGEDRRHYMISNNPQHVLSIDPETRTVVIDRIGLVAES